MGMILVDFHSEIVYWEWIHHSAPFSVKLNHWLRIQPFFCPTNPLAQALSENTLLVDPTPRGNYWLVVEPPLPNHPRGLDKVTNGFPTSSLSVETISLFPHFLMWLYKQYGRNTIYFPRPFSWWKCRNDIQPHGFIKWQIPTLSHSIYSKYSHELKRLTSENSTISSLIVLSWLFSVVLVHLVVS